MSINIVNTGIHAAKNVIKIRKEAGLTQKEMAASMGVSRRTIQRLEASIKSDNIFAKFYSPTLATVVKMASNVGSKLEDFAGGPMKVVSVQ